MTMKKIFSLLLSVAAMVAYASTTNVSVADDHVHSYRNGFCAVANCTAPYEPAVVVTGVMPINEVASATDVYEIANGGNLFWFAEQVNSGNTAYSAKLVADIDLEHRAWTPIGSSAAFTGEFDGDGHSITNLSISADASMLNAAFIGLHSGTNDIKNFSISGNITTSGTSGDHCVAGVVAYTSGAHKIQDIHCSVNIANLNASAVSTRFGGIVTKADGATINRCIYDGTITGNATSLQLAGILGWPNANNTVVSNCLFSGTITSTSTGNNSAYLGGIVGYAPSTLSTLIVANNLSIGTISSPDGATRTGAIAGRSTVSPVSYTNNFILSGLPVVGSATTAANTPAVVQVTAAQLGDGSLIDLLGAENWTQGADYPVPHDNNEPITEEDMIVDGIKYAFNSDNTLYVTYPNSEVPSSSNPCSYSGDITIPAEVEIKGKSYAVTAIGDYAFHFAPVTSLTLPEGILKLGYKAIYQTQLTEIVVPNSVTLMDYEALGYNKKLEKITFGENIASNTWGDKLCIYGEKKYEVYMYCKAVPELRSYTFYTTGAIVHVYPMMYAAFKANAAWNAYDIVGDLWIEYTYEDLQETIATYKALLPQGDAVGTDPGCYSQTSASALATAIEEAEKVGEDADLPLLNNVINNILIAYDALYVYPLNEGVFYIESDYKQGYAIYGDAAEANTQGLKLAPYSEGDDKYYFKLTRKGGNWIMQSLDNDMYVGTAIGGNANGKYISLTENFANEQVITWVEGGKFKIQSVISGSVVTFPYRNYNNQISVYNYAAGSADESRQHWRFHPVSSDKFNIDYNLENPRVRGFLHDFVYSPDDNPKVYAYNVAPPDRRDQPFPATIYWTRADNALSQQLTLSRNEDFSDAVVVDLGSDVASYEIYNLIPSQTYYYKVTATLAGGDSRQLISSSFNTTGQLRQIKANSVANIRDLGGWPTASGNAVRYGFIYRGAELSGNHNVEPEDATILRGIGIKAELDLRGDGEAGNITASALGNEVEYRRIALGQTSTYLHGLTKYRSQYKADVEYVFDCVKQDKPVYFHCAIGADRTGTLAFLLDGVLGVSESDIYKDFELTTFSYYNTGRGKGQLTEPMDLIKSVQGETLEQKFYKFFTDSLEIPAAEVDAFRSKMLGLSNRLTASEVMELISAATAEGKLVVDLSKYAFADDVTAADLAAEGNVLVVAPSDCGISGRNIIVDGICESLVLIDGAPFSPAAAFTANNATFTKTLTDGGWHSAVLPYETEIPEGVEVVNNASVDGTVITLQPVEGEVEANTPFLYRMAGGGEATISFVSITESVIDITHTDDAALTSGALRGTYIGLLAGSATGSLVLNDDGTAFVAAAANTAILPFSAYLDAQQGADTFTILIDDLLAVELPQQASSAAGYKSTFDLMGRKVAAPAHGLYVIDGKKVKY